MVSLCRPGRSVTATLLVGVCAACAAAGQAPGGKGDWPQWRGPERNGVSIETGLLKSWPPGGPPLAWKATGLGEGFSSAAIAGGKVFSQGHVKGEERVFALDEATGKPVWSQAISPSGRIGPAGSRSTPTVSGGRLFVETVGGDVACLAAADGKEAWRASLVRDFGGTVPRWGFSESPLVDAGRVVVTPGAKDAMLVALDAASGKPLWKAALPHADAANYSSPIIAEAGGKRQYVQYLQKGVAAVEAASGQFLWFAKFGTPDPGYSCNTPLAADGLVFVTSQWWANALKPPEAGATPQKVYETRDLRNVHSGYVAVGGHLYGAQVFAGCACIELKTGRLAWHDARPGVCAIVAADGRLYLRNDKGPVILAEAAPDGYKEAGRFDQPDRTREPAWAHPALANGRLYIRDQDTLLCYDVRQRPASQ